MIDQRDPGKLNDFFNGIEDDSKAVYSPDNGGNIYFSKAATALGYVAGDPIPYDSAQIESSLCRGEFPIVRVLRKNRKGDLHQHFVLVVGQDYSSPTGSTLDPTCRFKINDPGSRTYEHLDSYERLDGQEILDMRIVYP
jgi:hypothetical protein